MNGYRRRWLTLVTLLGGGMLLQTPTACQDLLANSLIGITTSVTNVFIEKAVFEAFGLDGLGSSLGSSLTTGLTQSLTGINVTGTNTLTGTTGTTGLGT
jgi:hypothetical protein